MDKNRIDITMYIVVAVRGSGEQSFLQHLETLKNGRSLSSQGNVIEVCNCGKVRTLCEAKFNFGYFEAKILSPVQLKSWRSFELWAPLSDISINTSNNRTNPSVTLSVNLTDIKKNFVRIKQNVQNIQGQWGVMQSCKLSRMCDDDAHPEMYENSTHEVLCA